jgi:hypothetical protein
MRGQRTAEARARPRAGFPSMRPLGGLLLGSTPGILGRPGRPPRSRWPLPPRQASPSTGKPPLSRGAREKIGVRYMFSTCRGEGM